MSVELNFVVLGLDELSWYHRSRHHHDVYVFRVFRHVECVVLPVADKECVYDRFVLESHVSRCCDALRCRTATGCILSTSAENIPNGGFDYVG